MRNVYTERGTEMRSAETIVNQMNRTATRIRRDGDAPFFENHVNGFAGTTPLHFEYKGYFDHAEITTDGKVKVFYATTSTNFRVDQMQGYTLQ
jgi:hypothetical protein